MHIRIATAKDIPSIYPFIYTIWEDMDFPLLTHTSPHQFKQIMTQSMADPYAKFYYGNAIVCQIDHTIVGVLYSYDGRNEPQFDQHFQHWLSQHLSLADIPVKPTYRETNDNEWYIDALIVSPTHRSKGIGTALIQFLCHTLPKGTTIGLNCELDNTRASALYYSLGFSKTHTISFLSHQYNHLTKLI